MYHHIYGQTHILKLITSAAQFLKGFNATSQLMPPVMAWPHCWRTLTETEKENHPKWTMMPGPHLLSFGYVMVKNDWKNVDVEKTID